MTSTDEVTASNTAEWYFDIISPFAYLQLPAMLALNDRLAVKPTPILFGVILQTLGQLGPAEIPRKREFTYRHVQWQAERVGVILRFPPTHPFNPITALRLIIAAGTSWDAVAAVFSHVWRDGLAGDSVDSLAAVGRTLGIDDVATATAGDGVKLALLGNTEAALRHGIFGVPTLRIGERLFWGNDATAMIHDWFANPGRFDAGEYARFATLPASVTRQR